MTAINALKTYEFEEDRGTARVVKEPIGVVGFVTPWNWPMNQICAKVGPALAHSGPARRGRPFPR